MHSKVTSKRTYLLVICIVNTKVKLRMILNYQPINIWTDHDSYSTGICEEDFVCLSVVKASASAEKCTKKEKLCHYLLSSLSSRKCWRTFVRISVSNVRKSLFASIQVGCYFRKLNLTFFPMSFVGFCFYPNIENDRAGSFFALLDALIANSSN